MFICFLFVLMNLLVFNVFVIFFHSNKENIIFLRIEYKINVEENHSVLFSVLENILTFWEMAKETDY